MTKIISNSTIFSSCRVDALQGREFAEWEEYGILDAGEAELGAPYEMRRASRTEVQHTTVWFVLAGDLTVEVPGRKFTAGPGMAVVHSSAANRLCTVTEGVFHHLFFYLQHRHLETMVFPASYWRELRQLLQMLLRETHGPKPDRKRQSLLAGLVVSYLNQELEGSAEPPRLRRMVELIEKEIDRPWTTAVLAARLNMSPSLLYQLCIRHHGESPGDVIRNIKFRRAATLLRQSDESLESIAAMLGYGSAFAFSKAYRKYTGRRPGRERSGLE